MSRKATPTGKKKRGRPPKPMPEPISDTWENVAKALLETPPNQRDEWDYLKERDASRARGYSRI